jgi:nucleoside-triphosphatase THEP1
VVGKYVVDVASFEALALPAMAPSHPDTRLVVIDEVGELRETGHHDLAAARSIAAAAAGVLPAVVSSSAAVPVRTAARLLTAEHEDRSRHAACMPTAAAACRQDGAV